MLDCFMSLVDLNEDEKEDDHHHDHHHDHQNNSVLYDSRKHQLVTMSTCIMRGNAQLKSSVVEQYKVKTLLLWLLL